MRRIAQAAGIGIAAAVLLLGTAEPAQADEQAFLDQIPPRNYISMWQPDAGRLMTGYNVCTMLRGGTPPQVVAEGFTNGDGWPWVNAAQHELCPDTLQPAPERVGEPG